MIDDTELIISFTAPVKGFYKVFRFNDRELLSNIPSWFEELWSNNTEPINLTKYTKSDE